MRRDGFSRQGTGATPQVHGAVRDLGAQHLQGMRVPVRVLHHRRAGTSAPQYPKAQVAVQLRRELGAIDAEAIIGVGSLCDAYPSVELRYGVTRAAIEELVAQERHFVIITKGAWDPSSAPELLTVVSASARVRVSLCSVGDKHTLRGELTRSARSSRGRLRGDPLVGCRRSARVSLSADAMDPRRQRCTGG